MKKIFTGLCLTTMLWMATPAEAATTQIKIDDVVVKSDTAPEQKNNRTMVPLRVISENLGAQVHWQDSQITLAMDQTTIKLNLNNRTVIKNGEKEQLDVQPYMKNNRTYVPIRFIAETFGSQVHYNQGTVNITTEPLLIEDEKIKVLRYEYHMTMGGIIQDIKGNAYHQALYKIFQEMKGDKVEAPKEYYWHFNLEAPGSYYKLGQFDFMSHDNNSVKQYDIYTLNQPFPEELLQGYPKVLLHDASEDNWYLFSEQAVKSIQQLMNSADHNGFSKIISNTVA
ncbi:copper amine oxidase N-terminal domain-containing protein [Lysinibacillus sp. OL1_EC]|uniref:copper amine oxidase N-terminal domain-containing protein n=1 Tax=unclassified Lysinibacillus TaxID=2636778 RepID=UPI00103CDBF6|nr:MULTISPECIES: copper amine oxidase N-terminal domain-containing protein [unclassified Lysinibacillus]MCM0623783.1 copper amine oxidase N-terminal domain-containing protein [Lysinibacillus sp. OL1_EC]TBV89034.1 copper amine oxidase N-terminal domain-containing protein [Lysinibacillus sp. OL1]